MYYGFFNILAMYLIIEGGNTSINNNCIESLNSVGKALSTNTFIN